MASTSTLRQIVVDDTDPAIHYGDTGWFSADPANLNVGNFGPIYNGTSHATTNDASLSFEFSGTSITVYGTIIVKTVNNVSDPTWTCYVDEIPIGSQNPTFQFPENNWNLCAQSELTAGPHNLTIQVQSKGQAFYLDDLVYTPTPDVTFERAVVIYPNTDPAVSFGAGWDTFGGENGTQSKGAQVALNFHGTSVTPFAFVPTERPHNATSATYSIDGGASVNFALQGLAAGNSSTVATEYNVPLFTTPELEAGTHNLVVTYEGDGDHTPLVVQGFYVTNTTTPASSSSSTTSPAFSSNTSSVNLASSRHSPAGVIAGGLIAGVFVLALLAGVALWQRKRRRRVGDATAANPYPMGMAYNGAPPIGVAQPSSGASGARSEGSRPSTDYPGGSQSGGAGSTSAVPSHGSAHTPAAPVVRGKRAREIAAAAALPPPSNARAPSNPHAVVVRHEDSGVRLPVASPADAPLPEMVELPPGYSPD
ncbi:hypothetical protein DFH07DRAFT_750828 [Mycena maculata]|uniref:Uncharacterized protein n=1 Tax=Mycena maculata TaxID=230809 RepID=A0AAD7IHF2_9AGAR|nr:hypothetical protein DFH07DRAFT_750828 [Mycena maculata]